MFLPTRVLAAAYSADMRIDPKMSFLYTIPEGKGIHKLTKPYIVLQIKSRSVFHTLLEW